ncbi:Dabb family protein [Novisyntrophococcus fermenticellae]|uniref:Dabb family protein n=1 Tax=Novisyntrophococcus fermenticellae TaxID=2068655 RepID=UPI001E2D0CB8|nr:Dabb family protein [Novisyntrophococcus fermenticellae]
MVHHIVMWNFKPEITEDRKAKLKVNMEKNLKALTDVVPGLLTVDFITAPIPSSTHDIALITTLEKKEDIAVYANHPAHVKVADTYVRPYVCDRCCLDFE